MLEIRENTIMRLIMMILVLLISINASGQVTSHTAYRFKSGLLANRPIVCVTNTSATDLYYGTDTDKLYICTSGNTWGTGISATTVGPGGSTTQLQYNNGGVFGGISGATTNGTATTFSSANLIATLPRFTTGINDNLGNRMFSWTGSGAANHIAITTTGTGTGSVTMAAEGTDTNIDFNMLSQGTGKILLNGITIFSNIIGDQLLSGTTTYSPTTIRSSINANTEVRLGTLNSGAVAACIGDCEDTDSHTKITSVNAGGGQITLEGGTAGNVTINSTGTTTINSDSNIGLQAGAAQVQTISGSGDVIVGDINGVGNGTIININDVGGNIVMQAGGTVLANGNVIMGTGAAQLRTMSATGITSIGDAGLAVNSTTFIVNDIAQTYTANKLPSCALGIVTDADGVMSCLSSDRNLKTNFSQYRRGLFALQNIHPQSYNFLPNINRDSNQRRSGFIAQDVRNSIPEAVLGTEGSLQVDTTTILATAVNAINELNQRLTSLERANKRLCRLVRHHR